MIKPLLSFALAAFLFPSIANAAVIHINYAGYVSALEGNGLGYAVGDVVSGQVKIDLAKALTIDAPSISVANYYAADNQHDLITGYHSGTVGKSSDMVDVYDGTYEHDGTLEDFLRVSDSDSEFILDEVFNFTSNFYSFYLTVLLPGVNWLSGSDLENISVNITNEAALAQSRAQMYNIFASGNSAEYSVHADVAHITFSSLQIVSSADPQPNSRVPESNMFLLFMMAFAGLLMKRLRNSKTLPH